MRGRFWVAALAAASPILLFDAVIGTTAFAQETAAAEDADDPNAGGAAPAESIAKPDVSMPAPADPAAPATSPGDDAGQPDARPRRQRRRVQTVSIPAAATPIVESIRAKLADPEIRRERLGRGHRRGRSLLQRAERAGLDDGYGILGARARPPSTRSSRPTIGGSRAPPSRFLRPASFRPRWMSRHAPRSSSLSPF